MRSKLSRFTLQITSTAATIMFVAVPSLVAAQQSGTAQGLLGTLALANKILNGLVALMILVAILAFFWGLIMYLFKQGEDKSEGLKLMFYGVIAIFVMVSIWGIIRLLQQTFGVQNNTAITPAGINANF